MRTWTLSEKRQPWSGVEADFRIKPENECSFADETLYRIIELKPVLDLLERVFKAFAASRNEVYAAQTQHELRVLLRTHGRLDG